MNIIDIANLCGVSKSTVSRYLTGGSISQKTADKIAKAIEETGFEHNVAAVQLKTNKSGLVGVIVDGLDSQSVTRILAGMSETCLDRGYQPFLAFDDPRRHRKSEIVQRLSRQGVDAIIYGSTYVTKEHRHCLQTCGRPVLLLGQYDPELPSLKVNDYAAGNLMGEHIAQVGASRVAYLNFPQDDHALGIERHAGFVDVCAQRGIHVDTIEVNFAPQADITEQIDRAIALKPDCIACGSDAMALKVLDRLDELQIACPDDVMLCGFGDNKTSSIRRISLTTVHFDYNELGNKAAEAIIDLIDGKPYTPCDSTFGIRLVERNTTRRA